MKQLLQSLLPYFNLAVLVILLALFFAMLKTIFRMNHKKADKYRTDEVFSVLKSVGIFVRKKPILTMREQPMFAQLIKAFPGHVILAQVSFQALLDTNDRGTRNKFNRKYADFVVCTRAFNAIAIVELDDASHDGRTLEDSDREKFLTSAGYTIVRYKSIPDLAQLRRDILPESNGAHNDSILTKTPTEDSSHTLLRQNN